MPWLDPEPDAAPDDAQPQVQPNSLPRLLRVADVAAWLGKSEKTVTRMIARGEIPAVTLGATTYVREADLIATIDAQIAARIGGRRGSRLSRTAQIPPKSF